MNLEGLFILWGASCFIVGIVIGYILFSDILNKILRKDDEKEN